MRYAAAAPILLVATTLCGAASAERVEFDLEDTLVVGETEISYRLDLIMTAAAETRLGLEALLDLRDFQQRLPGLLAGEPIAEGCGSRTDLNDLAVEAEGDAVSVTGLIDWQSFECERTSETGFQRGAAKDRMALSFSASASASLSDRCITFALRDLVLTPIRQIEDSILIEDLQAVRVIVLDVAGRFLEERPFCPELPPELASLDPIYESGGPREIEDGGLGLYMNGSIDVSTTTILDVLRVLQSEGVIPGPP